MPENINITQAQPEIPMAGNPPQSVGKEPQQTPFFTQPSIVTSTKARDISKANMEELSKLTGIQYNL